MTNIPTFADVVIPPTLERWRRGDVKPPDAQITDTRGSIGAPWRAIGLLGRMLDDGRITEAEFEAGRRFKGDYRAAHLDGLRASDLSRPRIDGGRQRREELSIRTVNARTRVMDAIEALGGIASPAASAVWCIIGEEMNIKAWVASRDLSRPLTENLGPGVLIGALGVLAAHYGRGRG
jgi:hypothetical protein